MQEKWVEFDPVNSKKRKILTRFGPVLDPGPAHGSGSDFGPGYSGLRPGSGRSTNTHGKNGKLSHVFGKNFVKATFSLKKLLNS